MENDIAWWGRQFKWDLAETRERVLLDVLFRRGVIISECYSSTSYALRLLTIRHYHTAACVSTVTEHCTEKPHSS